MVACRSLLAAVAAAVITMTMIGYPVKHHLEDQINAHMDEPTSALHNDIIDLNLIGDFLPIAYLFVVDLPRMLSARAK